VILNIEPTNTDIIYAASWQSVFKSTDGGNSWSETNVTNNFVTSIVLDPNSGSDPPNDRTLYIGTEIEGVFKSTDSGQNWTEINNGINARNFPHYSAHSLKIDDSVLDKNLYAGAIGGGFRSKDLEVRILDKPGQGWTLEVTTGISDPLPLIQSIRTSFMLFPGEFGRARIMESTGQIFPLKTSVISEKEFLSLLPQIHLPSIYPAYGLISLRMASINQQMEGPAGHS
jgi:photosystem II stability/assembly factor-like uncharacterized protein